MMHDALRVLIDQFAARASVYLPDIQPVCGPTTDPEIEMEIRGQGRTRVTQFCTGNYLGLARDPRIIEVAKAGLDKYGLTASSSRWGCGTQDVHVEVERSLAEFQLQDDAAYFLLTTLALQGLVPNIAESSGLAKFLSAKGLFNLPAAEETDIIIDQFTHESVRWACRIPDQVQTFVYRHTDMDHLESRLRSSKAQRKLVATDGVFSSQGDVAPLPTIVELAERYGAMVLVDDAHGTAVLGPNGRGTWEHFGVEEKIDFKVSSCAKALAAGFGAFISGDKNLIHFLRTNAFPYIFTGSPPPDRLLATMKAVEISRDEPWRRQKVLANAKYLREGLLQRGLSTLNPDDPLTPIVPVILGDEDLTNSVSQSLLRDEGVYAATFIYPAVPKRKGRVRFTVMSTHEQVHLDYLLSALDRAIERVRTIHV